MRVDFFLRAAVEWVAIADAIRAVYPTATGSFHVTVSSLYREAAWCHVLFRADRCDLVVARLQAIYESTFGEPPSTRRPHSDGWTRSRESGDRVFPSVSLCGRQTVFGGVRFPSVTSPGLTIMCVGVALAHSELPLLLIERGGLDERLHDRGGEKEVRFYWRASPALLPVWCHGRLQIVRWGNKDRAERKLPPTGWTWQETIEEGRWSALAPEPVIIPATFGLMHGVWFKVKQGMEGLLVRDPEENPVVFMVCQPTTRYYQVMTRADWMPALLGEVI